MTTHLRNVAIIAHVDHGKTTLVDKLLYQSGMFRNEDLDKLAGGQHGLIMDSNDLERERGITILSKNCAVKYLRRDEGTPPVETRRHEGGKETNDIAGYSAREGTGGGARNEGKPSVPSSLRAPVPSEYKINIIDTPGHADFGGEVERVLMLADGALLLVDAFEGPMPQTRFVLQKALQNGLKPIVVINKVDRPDARPDDVVNEVFDLLVSLDADDEALDFPVLFASARDGCATTDLSRPNNDLRPVFETIVQHVPAPDNDPDAPLQMLVTSLEYSDYTGRIAVGRVMGGKLKEGQSVAVFDRAGRKTFQRALHVNQFEGLGKQRVDEVQAGDICAIVGLERIDIGDTIADPEKGKALPTISVDEPTLNLTLRVNDGPFAGKEGKFVTSRQINDRLQRELQSNVALRVSQGDTPEEFLLAGRGVMHLGILMENMRREGYEFCAGKPKVIFREVNGKKQEPIERLVIDCPSDTQSAVMGFIGDRRAEMVSMDARAGMDGFIHMEFLFPARGLIGLRSRMLTATQGKAIMHHTFECYESMRGDIPQRHAGVMIATEAGQVTPYALDYLYDRGFFFVKPGDQVYEGQVVGEHCKDGDIGVNVVRTKKLTNIRAAGKDDSSQVRPARELSLEAALEYIQDDELVEMTPESLRLRKRLLKESDRRREARRGA